MFWHKNLVKQIWNFSPRKQWWGFVWRLQIWHWLVQQYRLFHLPKLHSRDPLRHDLGWSDPVKRVHADPQLRSHRSHSRLHRSRSAIHWRPTSSRDIPQVCVPLPQVKGPFPPSPNLCPFPAWEWQSLERQFAEVTSTATMEPATLEPPFGPGLTRSLGFLAPITGCASAPAATPPPFFPPATRRTAFGRESLAASGMPCRPLSFVEVRSELAVEMRIRNFCKKWTRMPWTKQPMYFHFGVTVCLTPAKLKSKLRPSIFRRRSHCISR